MKTMQTLLALVILTLTAGQARAEVIFSFTSGNGPNQFVPRYTLTNFNIASASSQLRGLGAVVSGSVEINEGTNELRLKLERQMICPEGMMCPAVMPTPTSITLPIRHIGTTICGGMEIVAERNVQLAQGGLTRVEVQDLGGSRCGGAALLTVVKRVKVTVTEQGLGDRGEVISVLSGNVITK